MSAPRGCAGSRPARAPRAQGTAPRTRPRTRPAPARTATTADGPAGSLWSLSSQHLRSEEATRAHHKDDDQQHEPDGRGQVGRDDVDGEHLREGQHQGTDTDTHDTAPVSYTHLT